MATQGSTGNVFLGIKAMQACFDTIFTSPPWKNPSYRILLLAVSPSAY
jgi:hypothetical protein